MIRSFVLLVGLNALVACAGPPPTVRFPALRSLPHHRAAGVAHPPASNLDGLSPTDLYAGGTGAGPATDCASPTTACDTVARALVLATAARASGGADVTVWVSPEAHDESLVLGGAGPACAGGTPGCQWPQAGAALLIRGYGGQATILPDKACGNLTGGAFGDALTVGQGAVVILGDVKLATRCPGRVALFGQDGPYVATLGGVELGDAPGARLLFEDRAMFEMGSTGGIRISGASPTTWALANGAEVLDDGATITCAPGTTMDTWLFSRLNSTTALLRGSSFVGCDGPWRTYIVRGNSVLSDDGPNPLPGAVKGAVDYGGVCIFSPDGSQIEECPF